MKWYYYILPFNQNQLFLNWNSFILFEMQKKTLTLKMKMSIFLRILNSHLLMNISISFKMFHKLIYMFYLSVEPGFHS